MQMMRMWWIRKQHLHKSNTNVNYRTGASLTNKKILWISTSSKFVNTYYDFDDQRADWPTTSLFVINCKEKY